jgi:phenylacetate-CoA ligase
MSRDASRIPWYARSLDFEALWSTFPPPPDYVERVHRLSHDALRRLQETRFMQQVERAWQVPFYQRHWSEAGLEPGDIRSLDDLPRIPPYTVHDVRKSIERQPPWGDFIGLDPERDAPLPLILQTSGGTTSLPRPMLYSPADREVMNILMGRRLFLQGVRPFDRVQIALSFGLSNGGIAAREGIWKYSGAIPLMTGSGANTPTRRQLEIMKEWKVDFLMGFPAYARHMAHVANDELGLDARELGLRGLLMHLGTDDRAELEKLWNAPVYDCYGIHECGAIAVDCEARAGMHVFEDAFVVEAVDPDTGIARPEGECGTLFVTALFKHLAPVIRYNVNDVSAFVPGTCACGGTHARLAGMFGRSDHMVKLRGVNVFPEAIGEVVGREPACNGEYVCIVEHAVNGQDELTVKVEARSTDADRNELSARLAQRLKEAIGVRTRVEVVGSGELDALTGLNRNSKIQRLIDRRKTLA